MSEECPYHCHLCNSQRPDLKCWKCGEDTEVPHPQWSYPRLPDIELIRSLAKSAGYALAVHGSLQRDLDIVAVPWTDSALTMDQLIRIIAEGINAREVGIREPKPHGRVAVNLQINGWFKLIDLSILPLNKVPT